MKDSENQNSKLGYFLTYGGIGAALRAGIGAALGNVAIGVAIGMAIAGIAIGVVLNRREISNE